MAKILCVCGETFNKRERGRCPHCHLRIHSGNELTTFEAFVLLEVEGEAGTLDIDGDKVVRWAFDPSKDGPERFGWRRWPNGLTKAHKQALNLLEMQFVRD